MAKRPDTTQKAFEINMDAQFYGLFAEIGAGQEVARRFFRAGGAAGTIAKSMSAYDMTVSDDIYGKSGRYVSQDRVDTMLEKEYSQLVERLHEQRGKETCFFAFADTVAARSYNNKKNCHGWLGMIFQHRAQAEPSKVIIHVRMLDRDHLQQQEALGIIGTNLIYSCAKYSCQREVFIEALMDNLSTDRIIVDFISVEGPGFNSGDSRLWSLELVKLGYCEAVMFDKTGKVVQPVDALYGKNILTSRGSYRPPTLVNLDMLKQGLLEFKEKNSEESDESFIVLPEISMNKLRERGEVNSEDFLARVDLLGALGHDVLITSFGTYGDLSFYLSNCTKKKLAFVMGFYNLQEVFDHQKYENSPGAIFGGIGALLGHRTSIFVYPAEKEDKVLTSRQANVSEDLIPLIHYLIDQKRIFDVKEFNKEVFHIWSRTVLKMIQNDEKGWEEMVPESVSRTVKNRCLFDYPCEVE